MTTLTPDMLNAVMAKQGMPNTTENLNRIAEFAALNPGMLEKYLGVGTDAGMVGNSIDASIANVDGAPRGPADPNGYISTVDPATGMSNIGPRLIGAVPPPAARGNGAAARPGIPGDFNAPVGAPPFPKKPANGAAVAPAGPGPRMTESQSGAGQGGMQVPGMEPGPESGGGGILAAIAAALAGGGGALAARKFAGGGTAPTPATPPATANARGRGAGAGAMPTPEALAAEGKPKSFTSPQDDPAKIEQMRKEVEKENLQNEMKRKANAARNTARAAGKR